MEQYKMVEEKLNELGISFQVVEHEPAVTIELADKFIEGMVGVRTKTMFMTDKKKTQFWMIIMDEDKRMDMKRFKEMVGVNQTKMASEECLVEKLGLMPGVVSPFGILNNKEKDIIVYFDKEIMGDIPLTFHPNTNEKTVFLSPEDTIRYLESIGCEYHIVDL